MAKRKRLTPPTAEDIAKPVPRSTAPIADVVADASSVAALTQMSDALTTARTQGRMVLSLPLGEIDVTYLVRDRVAADPDEMTALRESIRARGQQTPIDVVRLGPNRYGLISGWRRLQALGELHDLTGDVRFAAALAFERQPDQASDAYLSMVEENEIRVGLSHYERARIALKAVEQNVYPTTKAALLDLFAQASRPKRSKIRSFLSVVEALDGYLLFPGAIGERLGLALSKALEGDPTFGLSLQSSLKRTPPQNARDEQAILEEALHKGRAQKPANPTRATEVQPGLSVQEHRDGSLTLSGQGLTAQRRAQLLNFLKTLP